MLGGSALALILVGCATSELQLKRLHTAHDASAHVAVSFTARDVAGRPLGDLVEGDLRIYEDGELLAPEEAKPQILNGKVAAKRRLLLLVDMSGSVTGSDSFAVLPNAVSDFVAEAGTKQAVAVYAFDGSRTISRLRPFVQGSRTRKALFTLTAYETRDPSRDLHGAVQQAAEILHGELRKGGVPPDFGTLVVFTDGRDRAGRVSAEDAVAAVEDAGLAAFTIGVGTEVDGGLLSRLGEQGYIHVPDWGATSAAFQAAAEQVSAWNRSHYLLGYCSPARTGSHTGRVEVVRGDAVGELEVPPFNADGFGEGCDSGDLPPFYD